MANPGELIVTMGDLLGWSTERVTYQYRLLREAGMVTKVGRGFSAAKVTAGDAAALLIAALGELPALDNGSTAWSQFAFARCETDLDMPYAQLVGHLDNLAALPREHTLLHALTALVEDAPTEDVNMIVTFVSRLGYARIQITLPEAVIQPSGEPMLQHLAYRYLTAVARPNERSDAYAARSVGRGGFQRLGHLVAGIAMPSDA
jgi:hypothetical protein